MNQRLQNLQMGKKKKLTKEQEYPKISWENLENPDIQKATILYNDRVYTYRKMVELDRLIDSHPTEKAVADLAELRIRNLQCFAELQLFNDTGKFRHDHPLIRQYSVIAELEELLRRNPELFLEEYSNVRNNVARYRSYLNRDKKDKHKAEAWKAQLNKHEEREKLMKEILKKSHE